MTKRLDDKLRVARIVLKKLNEDSLRWTPLVKATIGDSGTPWKVRAALAWLLKHDYIERPERGLYRITEKGHRFLALNEYEVID